MCDLPVKLFINCKNSKRKASRKSADLDQDNAAAEELLSREEIYFTGKENIEGFACLVNVFIRQLSCSFDNVAVVNVDNHDEDFDNNGSVK